MKKKKVLVFILCALMVVMALSACKNKKEKPEKPLSKEEEYETDDDSYETFENLLQDLEKGINDGDVAQMKEAFVGGNVPGEFLMISGNYVLELELIGILNDVILEDDEIGQALIDENLMDEEYKEYARQATGACFLEVAIKQTTISDNSQKNKNNEIIIIALKIDGKWAIVPWI